MGYPNAVNIPPKWHCPKCGRVAMAEDTEARYCFCGYVEAKKK
jgi:ribosomal protein S27AE